MINQTHCKPIDTHTRTRNAVAIIARLGSVRIAPITQKSLLQTTSSSSLCRRKLGILTFCIPLSFLNQEWDEGLANKAQEHARRCVFESNPNVTRSNGNRIGENIHYTQDPMTSKTSTQAIIEAVRAWYQPGQNYLQVSRLLMELRRLSDNLQWLAPV